MEELPAGPDATVVIYRVGSRDDLVLNDELVTLVAAKGARLLTVIGHRQHAQHSWLPVEASHVDDAEALTRIVPDIADRDVYVCGAPAWMDAVAAAARRAGVAQESIHHERFSY